MIDIQHLLSQIEWYDNSALSLFDSCHRKYFYEHLWPVEGRPFGVDAGVGHGAWFGSSIHAGLAMYYSLWFRVNRVQDLSENARRLAAIRTFIHTHQKLFKSATPQQPKWECSNGVWTLLQYFDHFYFEDSKFRPIEPELSFIVPVAPEPGDPPWFEEGFYYAGKIDGVFERVRYGDWVTMETKTTRLRPQHETQKIFESSQSRGYLYSLKQFNPAKVIYGVLSNAIQVNQTEPTFDRDYKELTAVDIYEWRQHAIRKVHRIRQLRNELEGKPVRQQLLIADKSTTRCDDYAGCFFRKACTEGVHLVDEALQRGVIVPRTWNPFRKED